MPDRLVLMVQREVAERIARRAGRDVVPVGVRPVPRRGPDRVPRAAATAFEPAPEVDSAVIVARAVPGRRPPRRRATRTTLWRLVQAGFRERRKMLHNVLRAAAAGVDPAESRRALDEAGITPDRRPQTLAVGEWLRLLEALGDVG